MRVASARLLQAGSLCCALLFVQVPALAIEGFDVPKELALCGTGLFSDQGLINALIDSNAISSNAIAGVRLAGDAGTQSAVTLSQNTLAGNGNAVVLTLFVVDAWLRWDEPARPSTAALACGGAGLLLALFTGWLGGELVDRLGMGVHRGAHVNAPSSLSGLPATAHNPHGSETGV